MAEGADAAGVPMRRGFDGAGDLMAQGRSGGRSAALPAEALGDSASHGEGGPGSVLLHMYSWK